MVTYFAIPSIINIAKHKQLYDEPNQRSSHTRRTPSLGGIAIFAGAIFAIIFWSPFSDFGKLKYILCGFIILFLVGAKDDIMPMSPNKRVIAQTLAAAIIVFKTDIYLGSLYGVLGVEQILPIWLAYPFSIFTFLVIINSFNLIDGIDGLAGSLGAVICGTFGCWFLVADHPELATVAFATVGAIVAFLKYNFSPAQIFMGDTGSLLIGLVTAVLVISFIDKNHALPVDTPYRLSAGPVVAIGVMIIPLFDMLRVFITRILRGRSPFQADRRHLHHLLIDYGLSHMKATGLLVSVNILMIILVLSLHNWVNMHVLLLIVAALLAGPTFLLHQNVQRKKQLRERLSPV